MTKQSSWTSSKKPRWLLAHIFSGKRCQFILSSQIEPSSSVKLQWDKPIETIVIAKLASCCERDGQHFKHAWVWAAHLAGWEVFLSNGVNWSGVKDVGVTLVSEFITATEKFSGTDNQTTIAEELLSTNFVPVKDQGHLPDHNRLLKTLSDCWIRKRVQLDNIARSQQIIAEIDKEAETSFLEISKIWGVQRETVPNV